MACNHLSPPVFPYGWASEWGQDPYGLWQALTYKDVRYAFRWIPPGDFVLGSPEEEVGRYDWEDQHPVTISKGFWLGETTVTQALWATLMEENRSHFKDENRPVEGVSWQDCQVFMDRLNQLHPEFNVRLPWEAEWEYACRSGTTTPFSFGGKDDLSLEKVNYSGQWDKHDLEGETKAVKSYPCNPWGLYEMYGNVWEWCQDAWQEHLGTEPVVDPQRQAESEQAVAERVVRGGSWIFGGRYCRSAYRYGYGPVERYYDLGFRLSLGHAEHRPGADAQ